MKNIRFVLYVVVLAAAFLVLAVIKKYTHHPEDHVTHDFVGIDLYRGIFSQGNATHHSFHDKKELAEPATKIVEKKPDETEKLSYVKSTPAPKKSASKTITSSSDYFDNLIEEYKANVLSKKKYRNDVVVRYYKHEQDGEKAEVLVDYGFYLHKRPVEESKFKSLKTNVIYFGQDFPKSDLELITYLLVKSGLEIKEVKPFKDYDGWKHNAIEIGCDPKLSKKSTISDDQIRKLGQPK